MAASRAIPNSMPAWQHNPTLLSSGPIDKTLKLNQVAAVPPLKASQTLVKVLTASVNPIDYKLAELPLVSRVALGSPSTPGLEFVGRVWETKLPESSGIKAGDMVFGKLSGAGAPFGTLGSFVAVSGTDGVVKVPDGGNVELDWYAGLGVAGLTAYQSIVPTLEDKGPGSAKGKSVFINGSSGGVGTFAIQIAKAIGCEHIVATCSSANADLVRSLGATEVIDYRTTNVVEALKTYVADKTGGRGFDHAVDNAGADMSIYYRSHEYLREGAKYVAVGAGVSLKTVSEMTKVMLWPGFLGGGRRPFEFLGLAPKKAEYERLAGWLQDGQVKVVTDNTFSMDQAPEAYARLKTGRARGKIFIRVSEDGRGSG